MVSNLNKRDIALSVLVSTIIVCILLSPARYLNTTADGIVLWATSVLPGLLPFMFLTDILSSLGIPRIIGDKIGRIFAKIYGTSSSAYVYIVSILCGYPVGAQTIYTLYDRGEVTIREANTLCAIGTTSGPIFVIGTVGAIMLGDASVGAKIYICHIISALINGLIYSMRGGDTTYQPNISPMRGDTRGESILTHAISTTTRGLLNTGVMVTIFYLIADILRGTGALEWVAYIFPNSEYVEGVIVGILEMTTGCITLASSTGWYVIPTIGAIVSLGGVCIGMQNISYLEKCGVKVPHYILTKLTHSALTFGLLTISVLI